MQRLSALHCSQLTPYQPRGQIPLQSCSPSIRPSTIASCPWTPTRRSCRTWTSCSSCRRYPSRCRGRTGSGPTTRSCPRRSCLSSPALRSSRASSQRSTRPAGATTTWRSSTSYIATVPSSSPIALTICSPASSRAKTTLGTWETLRRHGTPSPLSTRPSFCTSPITRFPSPGYILARRRWRGTSPPAKP